MTVLANILEIALEVAPWLLGGLAVAGIIKAWIPERRLAGWLGGGGIGPIARGAVIGAPLPLCSCGAIPAAVTLHRGGASRGATTSFLVGTPGIGVDSLALTYALMGPFMAWVRPVGAVLSAIATGLLVAAVPARYARTRVAEAVDGPGDHRYEGTQYARARVAEEDCCCDSDCDSPETAGEEKPAGSVLQRSAEGLRYAFGNLLSDIGPWMLVGLVLAGVLVTWIPPASLGEYGSGWQAMLVMAVIGIPLYMCAQAATPIAAAMIVAGVSPGTALVFLLAAPMTSMATLAVLRRELGTVPVIVFAATIGVTSVAAGLAVDAGASLFSINVAAQVGEGRTVFPKAVEILALATLAAIAISPLLSGRFRSGEAKA